LRWLADFILGLGGARKFIDSDAREFLAKLVETNSIRVQSDILNRIQESRGQLEAEIRNLLHEVSGIAERALSHARKLREDGASAVQLAFERMASLEREVRALGSPRIL
jgi:polyhydroxyalkanoate synthesis regulator phasin